MAGLRAVYYRAPNASEPFDKFIEKLATKRQVVLDMPNVVGPRGQLATTRPDH